MPTISHLTCEILKNSGTAVKSPCGRSLHYCRIHQQLSAFSSWWLPEKLATPMRTSHSIHVFMEVFDACLRRFCKASEQDKSGVSGVMARLSEWKQNASVPCVRNAPATQGHEDIYTWIQYTVYTWYICYYGHIYYIYRYIIYAYLYAYTMIRVILLIRYCNSCHAVNWPLRRGSVVHWARYDWIVNSAWCSCRVAELLRQGWCALHMGSVQVRLSSQGHRCGSLTPANLDRCGIQWLSRRHLQGMEPRWTKLNKAWKEAPNQV